jgi:hypothetical protein
MEQWSDPDPGSGIKHPGSATLEPKLHFSSHTGANHVAPKLSVGKKSELHHYPFPELKPKQNIWILHRVTDCNYVVNQKKCTVYIQVMSHILMLVCNTEAPLISEIHTKGENDHFQTNF